MNRINIAVVEDNDSDFAALSQIIEKYQIEKNMTISLERFPNGESFLFLDKSFPLIVLDINLDGINGMELARQIRKKDHLAVIIFVTNLAKYACEGYEVDAMDYVIKPIQYLPFSLKLEKAIHLVENRFRKEMFVSTEEGHVKIDVNDVLYIEVKGHAILFHLSDRNIPTNGSLKEYEKKMEPFGFLRCNNCYLVNPLRVFNVNKYDCILDNGEIIAISHPKKRKFLEDLLNYVGKVNR